MGQKMTSATPAGVSRSRSSWTRRQRVQIRKNFLEVQAQVEAYRELYGDDDDWDDGWDDDWDDDR